MIKNFLAASAVADAHMMAGDALYSPSKDFNLELRPDGNLVLVGADDPARILWQSDTGFRQNGRYYCSMQADGNFVVYYGVPEGGASLPLWQSGTTSFHRSGFILNLSDDGALEIRRIGAKEDGLVWSSNGTS